MVYYGNKNIRTSKSSFDYGMLHSSVAYDIIIIIAKAAIHCKRLHTNESCTSYNRLPSINTLPEVDKNT